MKTRSPFFFIRWASVLAVVFASFLSPLQAKPKQPRMHAALDALHAARSAVDPIPDLQTALERLKVAATNKAGYRVEAAKLVHSAIAEVEAKHRRDADKLIDEAINKVEKGVASGN